MAEREVFISIKNYVSLNDDASIGIVVRCLRIKLSRFWKFARNFAALHGGEGVREREKERHRSRTMAHRGRR